MSLECKEVKLWEVPEHIANICYYRMNKNNCKLPDNWQSILYRYTEWIEQHLNRTFCTPESYDRREREVGTHLEELQKCKKLHFMIV